MDDHFLQLHIIYEDLPDLIELYARVIHGEWSEVTTAYTSAAFFIDNGEALLAWAKTPNKPLRIEAGADTGIGWMVLQFYTIDHAGHARCAITLASKTRSNEPRPAEASRLAIEFPTELGLIERFARECIVLDENFKGEARLIGKPAGFPAGSSPDQSPSRTFTRLVLHMSGKGVNQDLGPRTSEGVRRLPGFLAASARSTSFRNHRSHLRLPIVLHRNGPDLVASVA